DQAVGDIAEPRPAILFRDCGTKQSELAHLWQHAGIVCLVAVSLGDARHQIALREAARGVAHHALVFGQLAFQIERVLPDERRILEHRGYATAFLGCLRHETSSEFRRAIIDPGAGSWPTLRASGLRRYRARASIIARIVCRGPGQARLPSLRLSPRQSEGDGAPRGATICSKCPRSLSRSRGAARRATQTSLRRPGLFAGVFLTAPAALFVAAQTWTTSVSQAPGGRPVLATRRSPGAARVRACEARPRAPHPAPPPRRL